MRCMISRGAGGGVALCGALSRARVFPPAAAAPVHITMYHVHVRSLCCSSVGSHGFYFEHIRVPVTTYTALLEGNTALRDTGAI